MQSTAPLPCNWATHCPAGSALPSITWSAYIGIWVLVITLLVMWWAAVSFLGRSRLQRLHSCRKQVIAARLSASDGMTPAGCELARYSSFKLQDLFMNLSTQLLAYCQAALCSLSMKPAQLLTRYVIMFVDQVFSIIPALSYLCLVLSQASVTMPCLVTF